jgi:D-lyxose ketol-isomerase
MKRSQVNSAICHALELLKENNLALPSWAYWSMDDWRKCAHQLQNLKEVMLGWDVTDFDSGDFKSCGSVLFTLRNGSPVNPKAGTPYAEKLIFQLHETEQEIPFHFHRRKTEDIINRGGGILMLELYNSTPDSKLDRETPIKVKMDGIIHSLKPGSVVEIEKGCSITLEPGLFHRFWAKRGAGDLIIGEVSSINDDHTDNVFLVSRDRFSVLEEDEAPLYPLCNEYDRLFGSTY